MESAGRSVDEQEKEKKKGMRGRSAVQQSLQLNKSRKTVVQGTT